jgi:hypothetical protein
MKQYSRERKTQKSAVDGAIKIAEAIGPEWYESHGQGD